MEDHIQKHKNNEKHDREYDLQTLLGSQFEFIFACPFIRITRRQMQLLLQQVIRGFHKVAGISGIEIDVDVSGQRSVRITDHGGPASKRKARKSHERELRGRG